MYCPNCKKEYEGKFCTKCGTKLVEKPTNDFLDRNMCETILMEKPSNDDFFDRNDGIEHVFERHDRPDELRNVNRTLPSMKELEEMEMMTIEDRMTSMKEFEEMMKKALEDRD